VWCGCKTDGSSMNTSRIRMSLATVSVAAVCFVNDCFCAEHSVSDQKLMIDCTITSTHLIVLGLILNVLYELWSCWYVQCLYHWLASTDVHMTFGRNCIFDLGRPWLWWPLAMVDWIISNFWLMPLWTSDLSSIFQAGVRRSMPILTWVDLGYCSFYLWWPPAMKDWVMPNFGLVSFCLMISHSHSFPK